MSVRVHLWRSRSIGLPTSTAQLRDDTAPVAYVDEDEGARVDPLDPRHGPFEAHLAFGVVDGRSLRQGRDGGEHDKGSASGRKRPSACLNPASV